MPHFVEGIKDLKTSVWGTQKKDLNSWKVDAQNHLSPSQEAYKVSNVKYKCVAYHNNVIFYNILYIIYKIKIII